MRVLVSVLVAAHFLLLTNGNGQMRTEVSIWFAGIVDLAGGLVTKQ